MLEKEDLQAIATMVRSIVKEEVAASEERMLGAMDAKIERSQTSILSYIESHVEKEIKILADGHKGLVERMDRIESKVDHISNRLDEMEGELTAQEYVIKRMKVAQ